MVEGARLESVYIRKGIEGSNPSLSAWVRFLFTFSEVLKTIHITLENVTIWIKECPNILMG